MNKSILLSLVLCSSTTFADNIAGRWGIGGFGAAAIPFGVQQAKDEGSTGTDAGGTVRYGLNEKWGVAVSYDNIYLQDGIRRQPLTLSGLYYERTEQRWSLVSEFGVGAAASDSGGPFNNFSMKFGVGSEYFVTQTLAIEPQLMFHYITAVGGAPFRCIIMSPGIQALLYFGGEKK